MTQKIHGQKYYTKYLKKNLFIKKKHNKNVRPRSCREASFLTLSKIRKSLILPKLEYNAFLINANKNDIKMIDTINNDDKRPETGFFQCLVQSK